MLMLSFLPAGDAYANCCFLPSQTHCARAKRTPFWFNEARDITGESQIKLQKEALEVGELLQALKDSVSDSVSLFLSSVLRAEPRKHTFLESGVEKYAKHIFKINTMKITRIHHFGKAGGLIFREKAKQQGYRK